MVQQSDYLKEPQTESELRGLLDRMYAAAFEARQNGNPLWHMGIRDRRVLMLIKAMLKAGIMGEIIENPLGTPQGGIMTPPTQKIALLLRS